MRYNKTFEEKKALAIEEANARNKAFMALMKAALKAGDFDEIRDVIKEMKVRNEDGEEVVVGTVITKLVFVIGDEVVGEVYLESKRRGGYGRYEFWYRLTGKHVPHPAGTRYKWGMAERKYKRVDTATKFLVEHFRADDKGERAVKMYEASDFRKDLAAILNEAEGVRYELERKIKDGAVEDAMYLAENGDIATVYAAKAVAYRDAVLAERKAKKKLDEFRRGFIDGYNEANGTNYSKHLL